MLQGHQIKTQYLSIVLVVVLWTSPKAFSLAPTKPTASSSSTRRQAKETRQAGIDGYSVLRQPVDWDTEADLTFDAPTTLDDGRASNQDWWMQQLQGTRKEAKDGTIGNSQADPDDTTTMTTRPEDFDLFQRSLDTLDVQRVLQALQEDCRTLPARKLVREAAYAKQPKRPKEAKRAPRAYQPLLADSAEGAQERYRAVQELEHLLQLKDCDVTYRTSNGFQEPVAGRMPPLQGRYDLEEILQAADQGKVLEDDEIYKVSGMLDNMETLQSWGNALRRIEDIDPVELPRLTELLEVNATLQDLLGNAFDKDRKLSGTTFPNIGRLRSQCRALKATVMSRLEALVQVPSFKAKLALESGGPLYSEVSGGRLVVPVEAKYASKVGIVHDSSRSGKTVYVEPNEIVSVTNELRQAEGELRAEEARQWRSLTQQIVHNRVKLLASVHAVGQLDLVMARQLLGEKLYGVIPDVQEEGIISVRNAKHPVLLLRDVPHVVGSDLDLGANKNQGLVLTGPNSGGKTVILKLIGLTALMARGGIPVPVDRALNDYKPRVDFFDPVLADIGDIQSVGGDLSTFSGHMLICREVLANAKKNALVLMDEVGSGTDPNQGVAIAQALLEALLETGTRVAITTHYLQLKQLATADDRFAVGAMQFVHGRPTYKLLPGQIGESFAISVAERLKLPQSIIDRANELLDSETRQMGDLIRGLEDQKALADEKLLEIERRELEMKRMQRDMKEQQIKMEKKQLTVRREEAKKFAKLLEEKEAILEDVLENLKSDPSRKVVASSWNDIKFVKRDALNEAENVPSVLARKKQAAVAMEEAAAELVPLAEIREKPDIHVGDKLVICKKGPLFGREGAVSKVLGRNRVEMKVNNMKVGFKLTEVALPVGSVVAFSPSLSSKGASRGQNRRASISKAAERALASELDASLTPVALDTKPSAGVTMRTDSNTVDVRGCRLDEAKEKIKAKFSSCLMNNRPVVYVLHGHGEGGVLKSKVRQWLASERQLVKRFKPADRTDGGDAFTRVELR